MYIHICMCIYIYIYIYIYVYMIMYRISADFAGVPHALATEGGARGRVPPHVAPRRAQDQGRFSPKVNVFVP